MMRFESIKARAQQAKDWVEEYQELIEDILMCFGIWWMLLHLCLIYVFGGVWIFEDNPLILKTEIVLLAALSGYVFLRTLLQVRSWITGDKGGEIK